MAAKTSGILAAGLAIAARMNACPENLMFAGTSNHTNYENSK
jgi:hypothetical protein